MIRSGARRSARARGTRISYTLAPATRNTLGTQASLHSAPLQGQNTRVTVAPGHGDSDDSFAQKYIPVYTEVYDLGPRYTMASYYNFP